MILSVILSQVDLGTTFLLTSSFLRLQGRHMRRPNREQGAYLRSILLGHFRHYGVPMNGPAPCAFRKAVGCRGGRYCDVAARVTSCRGAPLRDGFRRLVCVILIPRGSRPDLCAARGE